MCLHVALVDQFMLNKLAALVLVLELPALNAPNCDRCSSSDEECDKLPLEIMPRTYFQILICLY
jgi:hypothetical protein